jgi:hypothetical protein
MRLKYTSTRARAESKSKAKSNRKISKVRTLTRVGRHLTILLIRSRIDNYVFSRNYENLNVLSAFASRCSFLSSSAPDTVSIAIQMLDGGPNSGSMPIELSLKGGECVVGMNKTMF